MFASRRYHRLSQDADSDGEEVILYDLTTSGTQNGDFGLGVYDHERDLNLPRVRVRKLSKKARYPSWSLCNTIVCGCLIAVALCIVVSIAIAIIVYGIRYHPVTPSGVEGSISSQYSPTPSVDAQPPYLSSRQDHTTPAPRPTPLVLSSPPQPQPDPVPPTSSADHPNTEQSLTKGKQVSPTTSTARRLATSSSSNQMSVHTAVTAQTSHSKPSLTPSHNPVELSPMPSHIPVEPLSTVHTVTAEHDSSQTIKSLTSPEPTPLTKSLTSSEATPATNSQASSDVASATKSPASAEATTTMSEPLHTPSPNTSISWERAFYPSITESSVLLYDMNQDGILDVMMVDGYQVCEMRVVAMDGMSGETVWKQNVSFDSFAVKCELDVDSDGVMDCLFAGRGGGFLAASGVDGRTLWVVDPSIVFPSYNFYFPLIVEDLDNDGVRDLINIHGGDPLYKPSAKDRSPAFLVVVSGSTGQKLMERIAVPDGRESYMSPILHSFADNVETILVGTGGETIPGSLWAVTMSSIRARIYEYTQSEDYVSYEIVTEYTNILCSKNSDSHLKNVQPVFNHSEYNMNESLTSCPQIASHKPIWNSYNVCVYQIVQSEEKGIMLPPVLVDMTGDGHRDLVVSTFDGHTVLLDGETGSVVWDKFIAGTESYSIPTPLYYTPDATPDLLVRVNKGAWNEYNYSYVAVLDGQDGSELWTLNSTQSGMMSMLSLLASTHGDDGMLFIAIGKQMDTPQTQTQTPQTSNDTTTHDLVAGLNALGLGLESPKEPTRRESEEVKTRPADPPMTSTDTKGPGVSKEKCHSIFEAPSSDVCPWYEWFTSPQGVHVRQRRHGGGEEGEEIGPDDELEGDRVAIDYDTDPIDEAQKVRDPPRTWEQSPDDPFPDPTTDLDSFLEYCGHQKDELTAYLYFLTRDIVEGADELLPLARHDPLVVKYPSSKDKRHGDHSPPPNGEITDWKAYRCAHIEPLSYIPSSPAIGDLNGDGRLEVAYVVLWSNFEEVPLPPKIVVKVFTLEDRFVEVYGRDVVDFSHFLSPERQPWTRYMGTRGDNVYSG